MEIYKTRKAKFTLELEQIRKLYNAISMARLATIIVMLVAVFYLIKTGQGWLIFATIGLFGSFVFLMKKHAKLSWQKKIKEALVQINANETDYLEGHKIPFEDGVEYNDFSHPYAYDLDIFGSHSLFANLNRTTTFVGKKTLAVQLLKLLPNDEILKNQEAVKELSHKIEWRQDFMALGKISNDNKLQYETLLRWNNAPNIPVSKLLTFLSFASPALMLLSLFAYFFTDDSTFLSYTSFLFACNLLFLGMAFKRIKAEIQHADNIDAIIKQYGLILQKVESEKFIAQKLITLQQKLNFENKNSIAQLKKLSGLFSQMDSIQNLVTTVLFNGFFLYHLHVLKALMRWKSQNAHALEQWLDVIGEFEMLNSLANFSHNNPDFVFPELNANYKISFKNLSHPLLNRKTRIGNDVAFTPGFMILTGSNMSGKSTFLRSLGVNMVLAGIGAPVCATAANIHPLPVLVSMRLSDSLSDSESYFYAEIRRLKQIMDGLESERAFVLLDEILRGTNSDDKRSGTIGVVKKMIESRAIGAIATHDVEVCLTTSEYPQQLSNQCFEAEIIDDDLYFDYKLRPGICKNKSATFLMKKMEII